MSKPIKILLGYEVGSGNPVEIPLHHTIVTGTTQLSGKTTTLEGLISRSEHKAIAFRTKRGEAGFESAAYRHPPYFRERADWQYVQSLLEATMRERLKFERSWIIRASKGTKTLRGVYENVCDELEKARGLAESVYTNLKAYLEIVLPELQATPFVDKLQLHDGLNVMDLVGIREEVQGLVIASTLEAIYKEARKTICVVPEAWKFLPQGRNTPVRVVIESLAREGAAPTVGNFVFLDSQDITGVDKGVLKQFDVWVLGRQREINEVERTLKQIPVPKKAKPQPEDVATLSLGHFISCFGDQTKRVYVQPAWLPADVARRIAMGSNAEEANLYRPEPPPEETEDMSRIAELERELEAEREKNRKLSETGTSPPAAITEQFVPRADNNDASSAPADKRINVGPIDIDAIERQVGIRLSKERREFRTTEPLGRIMFVLLNDLKNNPSGEAAIADTMREHGWNYNHGTMAPSLAKLAKAGDLISSGGRPATYRVPGKIDIRIEKA